MSAVRVDAGPYRSVYGREPSGRGGWLFAPRGFTAADRNDWHELIEVSGTFTEARAEAKRIAADRGLRAIEVCP